MNQFRRKTAETAEKIPRHGPVQIAKNFGFMLSLLFRCCPLRVVAEVGLAILSNLTHTFYSIFFIKIIIEALEKEESFSKIVLIIAVLTGIYCITYAFDAWFSKYYKLKTNQVIYEKMNDLLFRKSMETDFASFENPEFFDRYIKATNETNDRAVKVLDYIARFTGIVVSAATIIAFMSALEPMLLLVTIIPVVLTCLLYTSRCV